MPLPLNKYTDIMKHNRLFLSILLLPLVAHLQAQTTYEASALLDTDLSGTARYVGMGGAMSALGADMSTMSTNPAGTGLYRSWDAALSFSGNWATQLTQSNRGRGRSFDSYGALDNLGMVMTSAMSDEGILRFVNFGFNYRSVKRFDGTMGMASNLGGLSQTGQMAWQVYDNYDNVLPDDFNDTHDEGFFLTNYYDDPRLGWLTLMGAQGYLIDASSLDGGAYYPSVSNTYREQVSGGIEAYDFNLSLNLADRVYLGATLTTYDVDRHLESTYSEQLRDGGSYTLDNYYRTVGSGTDFKVGAIVRPLAESSLRIGLSATTRTVYTLCDYNSAVLRSDISLTDGYTHWMQSTTIDTQSRDAFGADCATEYTLLTPARYNLSVGGTIGRSWALGAEYEYADYSRTTLYDEYGNANTPMNTHTSSVLTAHHTLRFGAEKTFGTFYTRVGYNYQTGGYSREAWKMIPVNSVQTNTAYANLRHTSLYTCGLGYRGDVFYVDAALLYSTQSAQFFAFDDPNLQGTPLSRNLLKGMMTIGLRL